MPFFGEAESDTAKRKELMAITSAILLHAAARWPSQPECFGRVAYKCGEPWVGGVQCVRRVRENDQRLQPENVGPRESHDIIGQKPLSEWVGLSYDSISFSIKLSAFRGVNPKEEAEKLRRMAERGEAVTFVMGGAPVTQNK